MRAHVEALRRTQCFRDSRIVLIPEANLGNEAQEIADHMIETPALTVLCATEHCWGILTSPGTPAMYTSRIKEKLQEDALSYHSPIVTANPFVATGTPQERIVAVRKEFERQLRSFRALHVLNKSLVSIGKIAYTGKADKDGQRTNRLRDDMAMALLFGVFWSGKNIAGLIGERGYDHRFVRPVDTRPPALAAATIGTPEAAVSQYDAPAYFVPVQGSRERSLLQS